MSVQKDTPHFNRALLATAMIANTTAMALVVYWAWQFLAALWKWAFGG